MVIERLLQLLPPETAHSIAIHGVALAASPTLPDDPRLKCTLGNLTLAHPLGLAAGFDKNAISVPALFRLGFAFVEAGSITLRPQSGNPKPRIFRLSEDQAVVNRLGFNNHGLDAVLPRLAKSEGRRAPLGINVGINKDTTTAIDDYAAIVSSVAPYVDFITVNVSSPNTPGLRRWQEDDQLATLLARIAEIRASLTLSRLIFLKVAPDLDERGEKLIVDLALRYGLDGLIVSNSTLERPATLKSRHAGETGGLSGAPLFQRSTAQLARMAKHAAGELVFIGVGGVFSGEDAYAKIRAGASAVQIYSAFVYRGPSVIRAILEDLLTCLEDDGFGSLQEAVGAGFQNA